MNKRILCDLKKYTASDDSSYEKFSKWFNIR